MDIPAAKRRLVEASGDDTVRSTIYDLVRGPEWPAEYDGRSIRTKLTDTWTGNELELQEALPGLMARHVTAARDGDVSFRVIWAGEGLDTIDAVRPAAEIARRFPRCVAC